MVAYKVKSVKRCIHDTFVAFCQSISGCIDSLSTDLATQMSSLITQNFQIINKNDIIDQYDFQWFKSMPAGVPGLPGTPYQ